jgi:predicted dehydrogenase
MAATLLSDKPAVRKTVKPRLGFLGVGWIGRSRLEAIAQSGAGEIAVIADPVRETARKTREVAPEAEVLGTLEEILEFGVDGVVIATPSALHAEQSIEALKAGAAVFCQKPLGRNSQETAAAIQTAKDANLLLGVDLSYRFVTEIKAVLDLVRSGELGEVYAAEVVFHNAYGPDKSWYYDWKNSGGGCVIDLGIHLVDMALWIFDCPRVTNVVSRLFSQGKPVTNRQGVVEDYAVARLDLANGASVQMACSWKLPAGCEAIISGTFYGTKGGASFRNVDGSFYHFEAERFCGTKRQALARTDDPWGGRAAVHWARRLAVSKEFDPEIECLNQVSRTLDAIYGNENDDEICVEI